MVVLSAAQSSLCSAYISVNLAQRVLLTLVSADSLLLAPLEVQLHALLDNWPVILYVH